MMMIMCMMMMIMMMCMMMMMMMIQGLNLRQQLESLKQILLIGEAEAHEDVVTVTSLMETEAGARTGAARFDWDKAPICLMFTTR